MYIKSYQAYLMTQKIFSRKFSKSIPTLAKKQRNHYDSLGVTPKATQNDIKSAYYKLSMIYHPDKNKDSVDASNKFREITDAYEVLGNYRLRKLYDKGIIHTAGPQYAQKEHEAEEDDPETKFYKSRQFRHQRPTMDGRTQIYNFDEWTKAHYGNTFTRRQNTKMRYEQKLARDVADNYDRQAERIVAIVFVLFSLYVIMTTEKDFDVIHKPKEMDKTKEMDKQTTEQQD